MRDRLGHGVKFGVRRVLRYCNGSGRVVLDSLLAGMWFCKARDPAEELEAGLLVTVTYDTGQRDWSEQSRMRGEVDAEVVRAPSFPIFLVQELLGST